VRAAERLLVGKLMHVALQRLLGQTCAA
jgi:hypothetical protein